MRIRDILYTLAILICGTAVSSAQFLLNPYRFAAPVTPVSPGLTNLIAWYDFADLTDADGGTHNLSTSGFTAPGYTAGPPSYGTATDGAPGAGWAQTTLDNTGAFGADAGTDYAMVIRWRAHTSVANNSAVFAFNGGRWRVRYNTAGINGQGASQADADIITSPTLGALDTWYTVVISHDATAGTTSMSVNGETYLTDSSLTVNYSTGTDVFGGASTTDTNNIDIDFAGFWRGRTLTQANVAWLYNSAATRLYSEL